MSEIVSVRLRADEVARMRAAAERDGISLSEFVRRAARYMAIPVVPVGTYRCEHLSTAGPFVGVSCGCCGPLARVPA
jgi:hypothetical protein